MFKDFKSLCFLLTVVFLCPLLHPNLLCAQEKIIVGYGGIWSAGQEESYSIYSRVKQKYPGKLAKAVRTAIEKVSDNLPFNILFESDTESMKKHLDYPYSLAVAITRDDVVSERFTTPTAEINENYSERWHGHNHLPNNTCTESSKNRTKHYNIFLCRLSVIFNNWMEQND